MIKVGSVYLNPSVICAIMPMMSKKEASTGGVALIDADGNVEFEEAPACQVRFVGGGGTHVDAPAGEVYEAVNEWARRAELSSS